MKTQPKFIHRLKDQRGVSAIIIAIVIAVLIGFAALAVDIGYLYATKNELQNVADAAALAGAGKLGSIYLTQSSYTHTVHYALIVLEAQDVSSKNKAAGDFVVILEDDVEVGIWYESVDDRYFELQNVQPTAVRVTARRDATGSALGKVSLFFARILGIDEAAVIADAVAALTPISSIPPGKLRLPIGISNNLYEALPRPLPVDVCDVFLGELVECLDPIQLSPTTDSCAGWHNFLDAINAADLEKKLLGFIAAHPGIDCSEFGAPQKDYYPADEEELCNNDGSEDEWCGSKWFQEKFGWTEEDVCGLIAKLELSTNVITPGIESGEPFYFQGGDIASLFNGGHLVWDDADNTQPVYNIPGDESSGQLVEGDAEKPAPIIALFDYFRFRDGDDDDPTCVPEGERYDADEKWTTYIPIYDDGVDYPDCQNPNQRLNIVGFDKIEVFEVSPPPNKSLAVRRWCQWITAQGTGGGDGSILASIPKLVE